MEKLNNTKIRNMFNEWTKLNRYPSTKILANEIGINYYTLIKWRNKDQQFNLGQLNLMKVLMFLQNEEALEQVEKVRNNA